jgi:hypothetical protein
MNLELQGKNKTISDLISDITAFESKCILFATDIEIEEFNHFHNMKHHLTTYPDYKIKTHKYISEIKAVVEDLIIRFQDFKKIQKIVEYIVYFL